LPFLIVTPVGLEPTTQ